MTRSSLLCVGIVVMALLPAGPAFGQAPKTPDARAEIASLEKRVAKLEAELEAANKQLANPKRKPKTIVQLVQLGRTEPKVALKVLRLAYGDRYRFEVVHLKDYNLLGIRGDERTVEEAIKMVRQLEPIGSKP